MNDGVFKRRCRTRICFVLLACTLGIHSVQADEGGASFWLPGQFGSFSAVPVNAGWSLASVYYHAGTDADARRDFSIGGDVVAGLNVDVDLLIFIPNYAFEDKVWNGGQLSLSVAALFGKADVGVDATLTGPGGGVITGSATDSTTGVGDLYPAATVRWNDGVHNYMTYAMLGVPVGKYDKNELANLGVNHWSIDLGVGYTYLNQTNGREFSAVLGFTYNFENPDTNYQNGISGHIDWAASQFLSETFHLGLVGYFYHQLTGDSGDGAQLGDFKSSVSAIGPELGWFLKDGSWYVNLKGYYEFDAEHRPEGWNGWLTLSVPL